MGFVVEVSALRDTGSPSWVGFASSLRVLWGFSSEEGCLAPLSFSVGKVDEASALREVGSPI